MQHKIEWLVVKITPCSLLQQVKILEKSRAINRTYSGHSRYIQHNDPTAQYQSVDMIGSDGYLYTESQIFSSNVLLPTTLTNNQIFEKYISPLIKNPEVINLFYDTNNPISVDF